MIEEYFLKHITAEVPEMPAHDDDDDSDAEAERRDIEDKTARMAGNVWRMLCMMHNLVLFEERRQEREIQDKKTLDPKTAFPTVFATKLVESEVVFFPP
eukprot:3400206-Rhodomonas_salina.2